MELRSLPFDRSRGGWWLLVVAVAAGLAFVLHAFVGTFVLALFVYYGMRPVNYPTLLRSGTAHSLVEGGACP